MESAMSKKDDARAFVAAFEAGGGSGRWPSIRKADLVASLYARIDDPSRIYQAANPSCGPTTFVYTLAQDAPRAYAKMVVDLYTRGSARVHNLTITASSSLRTTAPMGNADPADWIAFASLRNSENALWPMWLGGINNIAGMTLPSAIADWMRRAGYSSVRESSSVLRPIMTVSAAWLDAADRLYRRGFQVLLFIDGDLLDSDTEDDSISLFPTHWVSLRSQITDGGIVSYDSPLSCRLWSWSRIYNIPVSRGSLKKRHFLNKFYGYVAGRY